MKLVLWTAVQWTFNGLLHVWRYFWVSPYPSISASSSHPPLPKCPTTQSTEPAGLKESEQPGHSELGGMTQERLVSIEQDIELLHVHIAMEMTSWETRFMELERKQQELRNQLLAEAFLRATVCLTEGDDNDDDDDDGGGGKPLTESEAQKSYSVERDQCSFGRLSPCHISVTEEVTPFRKASSHVTSVGSQTSVSSLGSRPTSVLSISSSLGSSGGYSTPHRAFVPHSPLDLQLGHRVRVLLPSGRISTGTMHYLGYLKDSEDFYLGVELETPELGLQDGAHGGQRYFRCKPGHGAFVPFNKLLMVWE